MKIDIVYCEYKNALEKKHFYGNAFAKYWLINVECINVYKKSV